MNKFLFSSFFLMILAVALTSLAQNPLPPKGPPPTAPAQVQAPSSAAKPPPLSVMTNPTGDANPKEGDLEIPVFENTEGYHYDPTGRRDPFKPFGESQSVQAPELNSPEQAGGPLEPLQTFDVSQIKLLGIIWQVKEPKAMVEDPTGRTHLIRRQTKIGRNGGFVAAIREGEVIIVEPSVGENGVQTAVTRVMNLTK